MNLKGTHTLSLGVVGQDVTKPVVQLGIKGRSEDGIIAYVLTRERGPHETPAESISGTQDTGP